MPRRCASVFRLVVVASAGIVAGCSQQNAEPSPDQERIEVPAVRFHLAYDNPREGCLPELDETGQPLFIRPEPLLTELDVLRATPLANDQRGILRVEFTRVGGDILAEATRANIGHRLAITIDGELVSSPRITSVVSNMAHISGDFSPERAAEIAEALTIE